ncbi:hypothetical protein HBI56_143480 [Parastagonospora nodorum]|uniref:Uncharacterized protein n=1 Tax=Phaeosphaeria nodorum (strain SN15 / ATCC MYA-4574 / FGSC 10173) TaxID=321614 RepID=A0A7U2F7S9_PHANO|nr:hypothetical protein HBH56_033570 [Parastagonospora nodorum]QRD00227.1 hypothetical protein JI435_414820 [Parastagonospora nodorum SN15]KAH3933942.1 hypothetical protein HBH54_065860 [Parastagonospora nodorum]KAH3952722.1 hypothetical protein HBH53_044180 [Parastagonospora nodorum]KAH3979786.1 hypothetical protein HBH51_055210 [Parastagonospora nodorum]
MCSFQTRGSLGFCCFRAYSNVPAIGEEIRTADLVTHDTYLIDAGMVDREINWRSSRLSVARVRKAPSSVDCQDCWFGVA